MKKVQWATLPRVDRECFGCGIDNVHGLQMQFETNGNRLRSSLTMEPRFRGWSNLTHGGILATILDETMGWTVLRLTGCFMLTKSMTVTYLKPIRIGTQLEITGYIKERDNKRSAVAIAEIRDMDGDLCAVSEGNFALFTREQFQAMQILPDDDLNAMMTAIS